MSFNNKIMKKIKRNVVNRTMRRIEYGERDEIKKEKYVKVEEG